MKQKSLDVKDDRLYIRIKPDEHQRFRMIATSQGRDMSEVVRELMAAWVREQSQKETAAA